MSELVAVRRVVAALTLVRFQKSHYTAINAQEDVTAHKEKECLIEIKEACAVKWVICNTNKQPTNITAEEAKATGIKLCFSQEYSCHHWGTYESKAALRVVQKQTKKNKYPALLLVKGFFKTPEFYEFVVTKDHAEHTPGDMRSDICTLPLANKYLHELTQQLEQSSKSASQIRIDMLRAVNRYGRKSERKVNYYDIWNLINKTNTSYSPDPSAFAYGFMSPVQQEKMKTATSFCLNTTHAISSNVNEILYTFLVRDKDIGRGWPVAFMVTNDQGVSPIVQWRQFLKRSSLLVDPKQFTIDCCAAEVHVIQTTFPATSIQFCIFHVTQAWNQKLSDSVKIPGSLLSETQILRGVMMKSWQEIIYEEDIDEFHHKIVQFKEDFNDQESFLDYFERNWCTEAKFKIWSRAYHE
ncbi:hypothetical protein PHYBLDRAFT_176276 [Phycomyces blakesleeanus NRRL 1555(-)]|uniref:Uncharacterized protein n=1 Tax=Phycomyces blakesleeanus (strain ATCC 8743b / DSM 1359 / FGSC 10004 / NBRC 33097 / NRRL 1555) TaxID=763407 RepID=A0A162PG22_PHYB8|nr:hypothetical protein PHYBLDRAFT_176276 [Phycomyces blakesleeanus NRRL 1555(-)]OAD65366.1 hypothetical protein PHYBLDRAFT_176276 [Phycomyces blakesleeanus NRRL 1555(-)]|eukprot:XP_018283406.1 hypothetical protein PHYBLDRAFT_176276 [Phycomyces blakesleeanus NRRL 1555(-)]